MNIILEYLGQQSTWKGIIMLLTVVGVHIKPEMAAAIASTGIGIVAIINLLRNEQKSTENAVAKALFKMKGIQ